MSLGADFKNLKVLQLSLPPACGSGFESSTCCSSHHACCHACHLPSIPDSYPFETTGFNKLLYLYMSLTLILLSQ